MPTSEFNFFQKLEIQTLRDQLKQNHQQVVLVQRVKVEKVGLGDLVDLGLPPLHSLKQLQITSQRAQIQKTQPIGISDFSKNHLFFKI